MFFRTFSNYFNAQERRLVFQSVVVGVVVWIVVFTLKTAVHELGHEVLHLYQTQPIYFLIPLVLGGLLVGALIVAAITRLSSQTVHYRDADGHIHELLDVEGDGLERAISLYFASEPTFEQSILGQEGVDVRWKLPTLTLALRKFLATLATLVSGGSGGLEASVTLIGESLAAGIFKPHFGTQTRFGRLFNWFRPTDPDDLQTAQLSGIAAAVATLLGAPFTAAFFATEVMYRRRPIINKLVYSLIAALVAFFLNSLAPSFFENVGWINVESTSLFHYDRLVPPPPLTNWDYYLLILVMSIVTALVAVQFGRLRKWVDGWFHHYQKNIWLRHLLGALLTGLIALVVLGLVSLAADIGLFGITEKDAEHALELVLGTGESVIDAALNGELLFALALTALFAKIFATLATIGSGGSAGLLVPSLFFGTMIATACVYLPPLVGLDWVYEPIQLIVPAMAASLVAIVNVPLAAILFVVEIFGGSYIVPALVALVITNLIAYNSSIYRTQREQYEQRQILPGYSVRRIPVPEKWQSETLLTLDLRRRLDVNIIGWLEQEGRDGLPHVHLSTDATEPLDAGDILVVLGQDGAIDNLVAVVQGRLDLPDPEPDINQDTPSLPPASAADEGTNSPDPVALIDPPAFEQEPESGNLANLGETEPAGDDDVGEDNNEATVEQEPDQENGIEPEDRSGEDNSV